MRHSTALELMDQPELVSREEMVGALAGLRRVNRLLGGRRVLLDALAPLFAKAGTRTAENPIRICDIGTGAGDLPIVVAQHARNHFIPIRITAVELNEDLCAAARRFCAGFPEIEVLCEDARERLRDKFDVVTASLFLHHFQPHEVIEWIRLMDAAAGIGWVVNDLERHPLAYAGIKIVGPLLCRNRVFLHDAPLSVRRSYTCAEWLRCAEGAGVGTARIRRCWPWRVALTRG